MGVTLSVWLSRPFYRGQYHFQTCCKKPDKKSKFLKNPFCLFSIEARSFKKIYKTFYHLQYQGSWKIFWELEQTDRYSTYFRNLWFTSPFFAILFLCQNCFIRLHLCDCKKKIEFVPIWNRPDLLVCFILNLQLHVSFFPFLYSFSWKFSNKVQQIYSTYICKFSPLWKLCNWHSLISFIFLIFRK